MPRKPGPPRPYLFKIVKTPREYVPVGRPVKRGDDERLTGIVQGDRASDIEERFARALEKNPDVERYNFRPRFLAPWGVGGAVELDFLVYAGNVYPVQLDGDYAHSSGAQKAFDQLQDARLQQYLTEQGITNEPIQRIPGHELETQAEADFVAGSLF